MDYESKKKLISDVLKLSRSEKIHIIKQIENNNIPSDKNKNGYYILLDNIPEGILLGIKDFVDSCVQINVSSLHKETLT